MGRSSRADEFSCEKEEELLFTQSSLMTVLLLSVLLGQCFNKSGDLLRSGAALITEQNHSEECGICMAEK